MAEREKDKVKQKNCRLFWEEKILWSRKIDFEYSQKARASGTEGSIPVSNQMN